MHGNPYLRLVRNEVETLVVEKYGDNHFEKKKLKKEIAKHQFFDATDPKFDKYFPILFFQAPSIKITT